MRAVPFEDLVGVPWEERNCWEVVREIYRRAGVELPAEPVEDGWKAVEGPMEWGDVVKMSHRGKVVDSVGVLVTGPKVLTAIELDRARLYRIDALYRMNHVVGVMRYAGNGG